MNIKAIFTECSMPFWLDVAERLTHKHNWNICYWTGKPEFETIVKKKFPDITFHSNANAVRGIPPKEFCNKELYPLDQPLLEDLSICESLALRMMNRMDRDETFTYEERIRLYHYNIRYWRTMIYEHHPDVVFFPVQPHLIYDYVLYELCKLYGIKTILFVQTILDPFIYPVQYFEFDTNPVLSLYTKLLNSSVNRHQKVTLSDTTEQYLEKMSGSITGSANIYLKITLEKQNMFQYYFKKFLQNPQNFHKMFVKGKTLFSREHYIKQKGKKIEQSDMRGFRYLLCSLEGIKKRNSLGQCYQQLQQDVSLNCPYIFMPLHYQPEATTSPAGEYFADQLIMIDLVSKCIPEDWKVYVKEHPVQFKTISSHGECSRTFAFYEDIASLPNVKLIPISMSTHDLIDHSKAVVSITGSVGWETILRGKPVLIFGHAWYKGCEGVFYTPDEKTCKMAIDKINEGHTVNRNLVRLFVYALEKAGTRAYLDFDFQKFAGISNEENVTNLTNAINNLYLQLNNKKNISARKYER